MQSYMKHASPVMKPNENLTAGVLGISRYLEGTMIQPIFFRKTPSLQQGGTAFVSAQGLQIPVRGQGNRLVNESRGCTVFLMC